MRRAAVAWLCLTGCDAVFLAGEGEHVDLRDSYSLTSNNGAITIPRSMKTLAGDHAVVTLLGTVDADKSMTRPPGWSELTSFEAIDCSNAQYHAFVVEGPIADEPRFELSLSDDRYDILVLVFRNASGARVLHQYLDGDSPDGTITMLPSEHVASASMAAVIGIGDDPWTAAVPGFDPHGTAGNAAAFTRGSNGEVPEVSVAIPGGYCGKIVELAVEP